ncbi:MAG: universal stress protein [Desulfobacteraceae bacterium]|jgi:nucleotide-binding universal stress UspA family protein
MFKKILFCTDLTKYCDHIFNYALGMAKEHGARLWIYNGLGRLPLSEEAAAEEIKKAEARVTEAYVDKMKNQGFEEYMINITDGDIVSEIIKLARNAKMDIILMGTSTKEPLGVGEDVMVSPLGPIAIDTILWAPCPVMIIPPALVPGLTRR